MAPEFLPAKGPGEKPAFVFQRIHIDPKRARDEQGEQFHGRT
jgi:hypothetical protein